MCTTAKLRITEKESLGFVSKISIFEGFMVKLLKLWGLIIILIGFSCKNEEKARCRIATTRSVKQLLGFYCRFHGVPPVNVQPHISVPLCSRLNDIRNVAKLWSLITTIPLHNIEQELHACESVRWEPSAVISCAFTCNSYGVTWCCEDNVDFYLSVYVHF